MLVFLLLFFLTVTLQISSPRVKKRSLWCIQLVCLPKLLWRTDRKKGCLIENVFSVEMLYSYHTSSCSCKCFIIYLFFNNNIHECHCLINLSSLESCFTSCTDPSAADLLLFHWGFIRICCSIGSNFFFFNSPNFPSWGSDLHFNAADWTSSCSLIPS